MAAWLITSTSMSYNVRLQAMYLIYLTHKFICMLGLCYSRYIKYICKLYYSTYRHIQNMGPKKKIHTAAY